MKSQRLIALAMVGLEALTFSYFSMSYVLPAVIWFVAVSAVFRKNRITATETQRIILLLTLALPFVWMWKYFPYRPPEVSGFVLYSLSYAMGLYFMSAQVMMLFFKGTSVPAGFVLHGIGALICAGNVYATEFQDVIYHAAAVTYGGLSAFFFSFAGKHPAPHLRLKQRSIRTGIVVIIATSIVVTAGSYIRAHKQAIDRFFLSWTYIESPRGGISFPHQFRLGGATHLRFGGDTESVLHVISDIPPGYLKGRVYTRFANSSWESSEMKNEIKPSQFSPVGLLPHYGLKKLFVLHQIDAGFWNMFDIWPAPTIQENIFAPPDTAAIAARIETLESNESGFYDSPDLINGEDYFAFVPDKKTTASLTERERALFTSVPNGLDHRIKVLAQNVFANAKTTKEKVAACERYFLTNYTYRIGINIPQGQDPLTYFLLNRPPAHCEYFASGAAILLRLANVPTRYVAGFCVNERHPSAGYWIARKKDAHAWVEAYDDIEKRWILVDATPPEGRPGAVKMKKFIYVLDTVRFNLQRVQVMIISGGLKKLGLLVKLAGKAIVDFFISSSINAMALKGALTALSTVLLMAIRRKRTILFRKGKEDLLAAMHTALAQIDRVTSKMRLIRSENETLHTYALRITSKSRNTLAEEIANWYKSYAVTRYSGDLTIENVRSVVETAYALCRRVRNMINKN